MLPACRRESSVATSAANTGGKNGGTAMPTPGSTRATRWITRATRSVAAMFLRQSPRRKSRYSETASGINAPPTLSAITVPGHSRTTGTTYWVP